MATEDPIVVAQAAPRSGGDVPTTGIDNSGLRGPVLALGLVALLATTVALGAETGASQDVAQTLNRPEALGTMNRSLATLLTVAVLLVVPLLGFAWLYNGLVNREESVLAAWAQTESNFQRRADLVPVLVQTVSRFVAHERETLTEVTRARAGSLDRLAAAMDALSAGQARMAETLQSGVSPEDPERMAALQRAEAAVGREIAAFLAVVEDYPALRSVDQFLALQAQIEGTENRINVARMRFNEAVRDYNGAMRRLPGSLVAGIGNFRRKAYFQAEEGASGAPAVSFE